MNSIHSSLKLLQFTRGSSGMFALICASVITYRSRSASPPTHIRRTMTFSRKESIGVSRTICRTKANRLSSLSYSWDATKLNRWRNTAISRRSTRSTRTRWSIPDGTVTINITWSPERGSTTSQIITTCNVDTGGNFTANWRPLWTRKLLVRISKPNTDKKSNLLL